MMSLKTREFTRTSVFSGLRMHEIVVQEHLPYVLPIVFSTTLNNINWSIGLEVTLSVLGFTNLDTPTVGTMLFWANQHSAMVSGVATKVAPSAAAARISALAVARFSAGSMPERIWMRATSMPDQALSRASSLLPRSSAIMSLRSE